MLPAISVKGSLSLETVFNVILAGSDEQAAGAPVEVGTLVSVELGGGESVVEIVLLGGGVSVVVGGGGAAVVVAGAPGWH